MNVQLAKADQELLDEACLAYEEAIVEGQTVTLASLLPPDRLDLLSWLQKEIRILEQIRPPGALNIEVDQPREKFFGPRYGMGRLHAEGGLGQVFVAQDAEVRRAVALKCLRQGKTQAIHRDHFLREAEITGRLEHPGIVPLYGLGTDADGLPFYAMRFIQGESLAAALAAFHQKYPRPVADTGYNSTFRELLQRLVNVCQTIAYAHSRGVIHRDLKPANVMVGKYGETLVVDWGMAKVVGREDATWVEAEETLEPTSPTNANLTHTGQGKGTPAFMSPEQANGQWDRVGPASDIFSLGATLYVLLTGRPPYRGPDALFSAGQGSFPAPHQVQSGIARALEAICRKAMALQPEDRYSTASEMARDLELWLADEPVQAYREPWLGRARRWARKHRPVVASVTAAVVVGLVALGVGIVRDQQDRAERAIERANLEIASAARQAKLEQGIAVALKEASHAHTELNNRLTDPRHSQEMLGDIDKWKDEVKGAAGALKRAGELVDSGRDVLPAETLNRVARAQQDWQDDNRNWQLATELDDIRLATSTSVEGKFDPAAAGRQLARLLDRLGIPEPGTDPAGAAKKIKQSPLRFVLLAALDHWALVTRDIPQQQHLLEVARLVDADPWRKQVRDLTAGKNLKGLQQLARAAQVDQQAPPLLIWLADSLHFAGGTEESVALLHAAVAHRPQDFWLNFYLGGLVQDPVERAGYFRAALAIRPDSSIVHFNLGLVLKAQGDLDGAIAHYRRAVNIDDDYAKAHINLANALRTRKELDEALIHYQKALALAPPLASTIHWDWALALRDKKDWAGAAYHLAQASQLKPKDPKYQATVGKYYMLQGEFGKMIAAADKGLALTSPGQTWHPTLQMQKKLGRYYLAQDQKLLQVLKAGSPTAPTEQLDLALFCRKYKGLYRTGASLYQAAFTAEPQLAEQLPRGHRYQAACCAVLAALGQGTDAATLTDSDRAQLRRQALAWLLADLTLMQRWTTGARPNQEAGRNPGLSGLGQLAGQAAAAKAAEVLLVDTRLLEWQQNPELAGVRDDKQLARLPADEQTAWRQLWTGATQLQQHLRTRFFAEQRFQGKLTHDHPEQAHTLPMTRGQTLVIDLESRVFPTKLRLEDVQGKVLARSKDLGEDILPARLTFTAPQDGQYRVIADSIQQQGRGAYTLTVRAFTGHPMQVEKGSGP